MRDLVQVDQLQGQCQHSQSILRRRRGHYMQP